MITIKDPKMAAQLRRELAAELSKPKPDPIEVQRIRHEISNAGYRCGANPKDCYDFKAREWKKDAADRAV